MRNHTYTGTIRVDLTEKKIDELWKAYAVNTGV